MNAYKQFLTSDLIVSPFGVNKGFSFKQSEWGNNVQIDRFLGTSGSFLTNQTTTGTLSTEYQVLVYNSTKELYYSNFLTQSFGDLVSTASIFPGANVEGDVLVGPTNSTGRYFNYLQSTLTASRHFPTGSGAEVAVVSVSSKLFGNYIQPYSFIFDYSSSFKAYDDGEGNLYSSASFAWTQSVGIFNQTITASASSIVNPGEIGFTTPITLPSGYTFISASWASGSVNSPFYEISTTTFVSVISASQGISVSSNKLSSDQIIIDFQDNATPFPSDIYLYFESGSLVTTSGSISANQNVGNIIYPHGMAIFTNQNLPLNNITTLANATCSFSSSLTIYETQYKCTIRENEFNFSLNPSLLSGSTDGTVNGYVTSSYFSPFVTTVGLYDEAQNLLAVGKLSQPLPTSPTTDTTILINIDR
jgi:hypothetical protein